MTITSEDIAGAWAIMPAATVNAVFEKWPEWTTDYCLPIQVGGLAYYFVFGPSLCKVAVELGLPFDITSLRTAFELAEDIAA